MLDKTLLELIVCPKCKGKVAYQAEKNILACPACKLAYPIHNDIPVLLNEEAELLVD
ncbi:MAG: Trm112 family protein [Mariprofundaceae bacterium]|nr:Trm112 family protein [Mariprofundaceae bacterium]